MKLSTILEGDKKTKKSKFQKLGVVTRKNSKKKFLQHLALYSERIVRSVKRCLKKIWGKNTVTYEELQTKLYEIEIILNNRLLTFTFENPNDPVLTPNHLLFDRRLNLQVIVSKEEETMYICSRYKHIQNLIEHFTWRWENEYLIELREFHQTKSNKKDKRDNQIRNVGDVVLIYEENTSKMMCNREKQRSTLWPSCLY